MTDLTRFCATDRHNLAEPWSRGEWTYATNGHIAVRVPRRADVSREDGPDLQAIMDKVPQAVTLAHIPPYERPKMMTCDTCRGGGRVIECADCEGSGETECSECGQDTQCHSCRGDGTWPARMGEADTKRCDDCQGVGRRSSQRVVCLEISPGVAINEAYAHIIQSLNARIDIASKPNSYEAIRFVFDGGDGCVMPIRYHATDPGLIRPFAMEAV